MPLWLHRNIKIRAKDGADVWLNRNTWSNHICLNHPEMKACLGDISDTLQEPDAIYFGNNTYFAYRWSERRGKFIMVLYTKNNRQGRVKTAYMTSDPESIVLGKIKVYPHERHKNWVQRAFS
jgi:hypothetical protein